VSRITPRPGSHFWRHAIGSKVQAIKEQLEAQPNDERRQAWFVMGLGPGCEISTKYLAAYDDGCHGRLIANAAARLVMKGRKR